MEKREAMLALETDLINKIKEDIKNKENIEDISIKPIREIDEFIEYGIYEQVFKCDYINKNGQNISCYIKPNNICHFKNLNTVFSMTRSGGMGYNIPEFSYYPNIEINNKNVFSNEFFIDDEKAIDLLITEDAKNYIESDYLIDNGEITEVSEHEAIDRILMALNFSINDNKTINVKKLNKNNNKIKTIYFDPNVSMRSLEEFFNFFKNVLIENNPYDSNKKLYCNKIDETCYDNIEKIPFKNLQENYYKTFEVILLKLFAEFLGVNKEIESITIEKLEKKFREKLNSYKTENTIILLYDPRLNNFIEEFSDFLINKDKELYKKELSKKAYYYKKNIKFFNKINDIIPNANNIEIYNAKINFSICSKIIDEYFSEKNKDIENYQPIILSNLINYSNKINEIKNIIPTNISILNFKKPKGILYTEDIENNGFKVEQLYKEDKKIEDLVIAVDNSKFGNLETKEGRQEIQNKIIDSLIEIANNNRISLAKLSVVILNYRNGRNENSNENIEEISRQFEEKMKENGIYEFNINNPRNINNGLGLKNLPKSIIELLIDNKEKFQTNIEDNYKKLSNLEQLLKNFKSFFGYKEPFDLDNPSNRDKEILNRIIKEFEEPVELRI